MVLRSRTYDINEYCSVLHTEGFGSTQEFVAEYGYGKFDDKGLSPEDENLCDLQKSRLTYCWACL